MEESNNQKYTYEIESNSIKYNLTLFINYDQITFKLETKNNNKGNKLYKNSLSLKDLCKMNKVFRIVETEDECLKEFNEYLEQSPNISIIESDNDIIIKFTSLLKINSIVEIRLIEEKKNNRHKL